VAKAPAQPQPIESAPLQSNDASNQRATQESASKVAEEKNSRRLMLDLAKLEKMGFLTPESGRSQLAEEMRHIKLPLLLNAFVDQSDFSKNNLNLIMVTSSRPGEGKTYTSLNLAMSIAKERDKTVLLVDADVAKPGVTRVLGMESAKGLVDYLLDDGLDIPDVMLKTNVPNLRFIPAGRRHIHSTELLTSENMKQLIEELATRYPDRVVIFDSPPLLATSEASVVAELVGQIVMVVEAEQTSKEEVQEALSLIGENKVLGLVLNKSRGSFGTDYYGYYGKYGE
jgi:exopolysaccharide/PEP-CTERM locus tyrosine autokinase